MLVRNRWWLMAVLVGFAAGLLATVSVDHAAGQGKKKKPPIDPKKVGNAPVTYSSNPRIVIAHGGDIARIVTFDFSADGKKVVVIGTDEKDQEHIIQIWDAASRDLLQVVRLSRKLKVETGSLHCQIALSPDGKTLAVSRAPFHDKKAHILGGGNTYLIQLETGRTMELEIAGVAGGRVKSLGLTQPGGVVVLQPRLLFSPDGDSLARFCGHFEPLVIRGMKTVWNPIAAVPQFEEFLSLPPVMPVAGLLAFSPDGSKLAWGGLGRGGPKPPASAAWVDLRVQKAATGFTKRKIGELPLGNAVGTVAWSESGTRLVVVWTIRNPKGADEDSKIPPYQQVIQVCTLDGFLVRTADHPLPAGHTLNALLFGGIAQRPGVVFRSENEVLFYGQSTKDDKACAVVRFDAKTRKFDDVYRFQLPLPGARMAPDLKRIAAQSSDREVSILDLDLEGTAAYQPLKVPQRATTAFALGKKGRKVAWTGADSSKLIAGIDLETVERLPGELNSDDFQKPGPAESGFFKVGGMTVYAAGQEWVVWTKEGYYAASPGGEKLVGWQVGNGTGKLDSYYPVERFRKKFYRPDVMAMILERKGNVGAALRAADLLRGVETHEARIDETLPPRALLTVLDQSKLPEVKLKVEAEASSKKQPVTALRLLVDGRPLPEGAAYKTYEEGQDKAHAEWTITLPPGPHQLTVLARSADSSSKSNTVEVAVADPTKQNTLHVLAIGVNDYEDGTLKLDFAAKDAMDIAASFPKSSKGDLFHEVTSKALVNAKARKEAILKQMAELRKQVKPNDLVVIFFAGHGVKEKEKFYLLPVEAKTDNLARTAISGEELRKSLGEISSVCQVLLILDACHSAGSLKNFRPAVDDITRSLTDDECGVAVLCSAMAHEKALEKQGNGLFTAAVLDGLSRKEGVPFNTSNRLFYVHHLHSYVFDRVSDMSGGRQHPFLSLPWVVESFPVARFSEKP